MPWARSFALTVAAVIVLSTGCGDPLVVLGDAPNFMRVIAGVGDSIGTRVDSIATRTRFTDVSAIAFDPATGTLYIADRGSVIQSGGTSRPVARLFAVASNGRLQLLLDRGGCPAALCVDHAQGMVFSQNALIIADVVANRIIRFDVRTRALAAIAGSGAFGDSPDGTPALEARLAEPMDVLVGDDGRIMFSERRGHRVRVISLGGALGTIAGTGTAGFAGDGGPALQAQLSGPTGIALDRDVMHIADTDNQRIRAVDLGRGTIATIAGTGTPGFYGDAGPPTEAQLARPRDLAASPDGGTLFVSDQDNHRIRSINLEANVIRTYAGNGSARFIGEGPAGAISLHGPTSLVTTSLGFLFVTDTGHYIIWRTTL